MRKTAQNLIDEPGRVRALTKAIFAVADRLEPIVDLSRPYVDGLENLPRDGRFLLVGNHTTFGMAEIVMIPYFVHRELGVRVRGLADRNFGNMRGLSADVLAAAGAVIGEPENGAELMLNDETVLVFPGGGREMPKFKGEEYRLRWERRFGFARLAIAHDYPIVPVGLVGGDDVYHGLVERDSALGRVSQFVGSRLGGRPDMAIPPTGSHSLSRPQADVSALRHTDRDHQTASRPSSEMASGREGTDPDRARNHSGRPASAARNGPVPEPEPPCVEQGRAAGTGGVSGVEAAHRSCQPGSAPMRRDGTPARRR